MLIATAVLIWNAYKNNAILFDRHGMSYTISGLVKTFTTEGYNNKKPLIVREQL